MKLGNWTQHFLISLHLSRMLGRSIPLRFTSLLAAASCRPGPFPSFTDHCGTWFSVPLHCNFCHLPEDFMVHPQNPLSFPISWPCLVSNDLSFIQQRQSHTLDRTTPWAGSSLIAKFKHPGLRLAFLVLWNLLVEQLPTDQSCHQIVHRILFSQCSVMPSCPSLPTLV